VERTRIAYLAASRSSPRAIARHNVHMHVCHVITRLIIGGAQENTLLTCEGLHARGRRVTLVTGPTTGPEGSLVERARQGGYELIEVPDLVRSIHPWLDLQALAELKDLFRRLRPDIVHTHSSKAGIIARQAAWEAGVRHIVHTIHGMSFNRTQVGPVRSFYAWLERNAARKTDAIVTVADAMIEQSLAAGVGRREQFTTVYSGMETERFDPGRYDRVAVRSRWGIGDDGVVVGAIARLFRKKGYEQLIPIMARAAALEPRLRFVWVGDGAQREQYEAQLRTLGLRERTTLTGLVRPEQVPEQLAGFDILAHASQWEGLPRGVVQALLMEVPAVAFEIDGTPEVIEDGVTGRIVPLGDIGGFAQRIVELAGDGKRRAEMGRIGREKCLARFNAGTMVEQLDALYSKLMPK
jgi:glycosyltransferase involved in cell wall biosynthesis